MATGIHVPFTKHDANRVLCTLLLFELLLVLVFVTDALVGIETPIQKLFNLDSEANIPSWFSSLQLGLVGILFLVLWHGAPKLDSRTFFLVVGLGFLFLSMDEAAEFHEKLTRALGNIEWVPQFKGGIWIPLYLSGAALVGLAYRRSIVLMCRRCPREMLVMAAGFVLILIGSAGLETMMHLFWAQNPTMYKIEVIAEEFFEMAGASVVLYGTLLYALANPALLLQKQLGDTFTTQVDPSPDSDPHT